MNKQELICIIEQSFGALKTSAGTIVCDAMMKLSDFCVYVFHKNTRLCKTLIKIKQVRCEDMRQIYTNHLVALLEKEYQDDMFAKDTLRTDLNNFLNKNISI